MGFVIYLEGFVPRAPYEALPQPYRTYESSFYLLSYWSLSCSFCWILMFYMPSTSSMYFLSIYRRVFPVTFSTLNILMKSSNPYS